ncbi:MAG: hypothetical protein QXL31_05970 [Thermosphaera sp.]
MSEKAFQDELKRAFEAIIGRFRFGGLEFSRVERDWSLVDAWQPDIVLFLKPDDKPFLVIETKRKIEEHGRTRGLFEPLGKAAIGQAISYPAPYYHRYGVSIPFFSTANPMEIAVFRIPENVLDYVSMDAVRAREYEKVVRPGKLSELISVHLVVHKELRRLDGGSWRS